MADAKTEMLTITTIIAAESPPTANQLITHLFPDHFLKEELHGLLPLVIPTAAELWHVQHPLPHFGSDTPVELLIQLPWPSHEYSCVPGGGGGGVGMGVGSQLNLASPGPMVHVDLLGPGHETELPLIVHGTDLPLGVLTLVVPPVWHMKQSFPFAQ